MTWKINITASGFLDFTLIVAPLESRRIFFLTAPDFFSVYKLLLFFHFASSELTLFFSLLTLEI